MAFIFGLQILWFKVLVKIFQSKGLKPKNKGHMNFYQCCDLTKKVYLFYIPKNCSDCSGPTFFSKNKQKSKDRSSANCSKKSSPIVSDSEEHWCDFNRKQNSADGRGKTTSLKRKKIVYLLANKSLIPLDTIWTTNFF